jgi:glycosyltransferase involved in cell wall biosynthesis
VNVVFITPGTGSFHCGSCLRDVAALRALRRRGVDATCVPMYLPLVTEGPAPDGTPLQFGGINVFLQHKFRLFRRTPAWLDSLFNRPWALALATRGDHMTDPHELGALTHSMLQGSEGRQQKEVGKLVDWLGGMTPRPDLIHLSNAMLLGLAPALREGLGIPLVCTLQGEDSFLDSLPEPYRTRAWDLVGRRAHEVEALIGVSRYYGETMRSRLGLPMDRVRIIRNGVDLEGFHPRHEPIDPPVIGFLARMIPEKGLGLLVDAFLQVFRSGRVPGVRLHVAGAQTRADVRYVETLRQRIQSAGAESAVQFFPNLEREEKIRFLRRLSVLSVPATYGESFGMYVVEAMACGVPVVQPAAAAFPELIEATGGGLLVPPNDANALAEGLITLLTDSSLYRRLGASARENAPRHFSVDRMAAEMEQLFAEILGEGAATQPAAASVAGGRSERPRRVRPMTWKP